MQLTARDVDTGSGGRVHYTCSGDCGGGALAVTPDDGELLVAAPLDADSEEGRRLVVAVVATDGGGMAATATVTVTG